ncbi:hypothetical protein HPP92_010721 [Vanilla planifolia]|uniref:Uncharacterized protein n=1 Tax=Vanilla planifolia TaxID=51239 RepID=A0A835QXP5_VANPL|nr:hypothetical protein HPP92_010721 [Vanilla planifolia]
MICLFLDQISMKKNAGKREREVVGDSADSFVAEGSGDVDDGDDASSSCVMGGGEDDGRGATWRMWCVLEQEAARGERREKGRADVKVIGCDVPRRGMVEREAEESRLFWEACLADESPSSK